MAPKGKTLKTDKRAPASSRSTSKAKAGLTEAADMLHPRTVKQVARRMPPEDALVDLADLFKVFGDTTRMRILSALSYSELCVHDLSALLGMTTSAVSHQLKTLRAAKLVRTRKDGKVVYYSLDDEHVNAIIAIGMQHITEG